MGLPLELQIEIVSMLDSWEIGCLARCSKVFLNICLDPILNLMLSKKRTKGMLKNASNTF